MKFLFLSQGEKVQDHPGWHNALERLKEEGKIKDFLNLPYLGFAKAYGWEAFYNKVVSLCENEGFDVVYFHYFHRKGKPSPKTCVERLKKITSTNIELKNDNAKLSKDNAKLSKDNAKLNRNNSQLLEKLEIEIQKGCKQRIKTFLKKFTIVQKSIPIYKKYIKKQPEKLKTVKSDIVKKTIN